MATAARFCELHEQQEQYCAEHRMMCCRICHGEIFPDCTIRDVQQVVVDLSGEIKKSQQCLRDLKTDMGNPTRKEDGVKDKVRSYFNKLRKLIDSCEDDMLQRVQKEARSGDSKKVDASQLEKRIDSLCSKIDKLNLTDLAGPKSRPEAATSQPTHSHEPHEGSAAMSATTQDQYAPATIVTADQYTLVEKLTGLKLELDHVIRQCTNHEEEQKHRLTESGELEFIVDSDSTEMIRRMINSSCDINRDSPVTSLKKSSEINTAGTRPCMRFLTDEATSPLVVGTYNPHKLMVVTWDGSVSREVTIDSQPYDLHIIDNMIYVSLDNINNITVRHVVDLRESTTIQAPGGPYGLTSIEKDLVVVCYSDRKVRRMKTDGTVRFESRCKLDGPYYVAARHNAVFVSDYSSSSSSSRVVVLTPDLCDTIRIVTYGGMSGPYGLCVRRNKLYVCSYNNHRILELETDGSGGRIMLEGGEVHYPWSVCIDGRGKRLAVGNASNKKILLYNTIH